jgi:hypothetical protein
MPKILFLLPFLLGHETFHFPILNSINGFLTNYQEFIPANFRLRQKPEKP